MCMSSFYIQTVTQNQNKTFPETLDSVVSSNEHLNVFKNITSYKIYEKRFKNFRQKLPQYKVCGIYMHISLHTASAPQRGMRVVSERSPISSCSLYVVCA